MVRQRHWSQTTYHPKAHVKWLLATKDKRGKNIGDQDSTRSIIKISKKQLGISSI
jgi:hypothetical protein